MSFAFGFGGDDIEADSDHDDLVQKVENCNIDDTPLIPPTRHTLQELLSYLPSQISYNLLPISRQQGNAETSAESAEILVPRRSVFDIRTQLMAEANPEENDNDSLLVGLERGDLRSGIYEGGFKTWECSLDLASLVADLSLEHDLHVVELGAGSAVPSLAILYHALSRSDRSSVHFTLCDYNEDVLRLATAPNVFLAGETKKVEANGLQLTSDMDIEDIDEGVIHQSTQRFEKDRLSFDFISGAWGQDFVDLLRSNDAAASSRPRTMLILASETIYSPKSTKDFVDTLLQLLRLDSGNSKAWVAAKKVYFGVGGGVDDFIQQVELQHGTVRVLLDVKDVGVGRVVLEIVADV